VRLLRSRAPRAQLNQRVPVEEPKPDAREGTIEKDESYVTFLKALEARRPAAPTPLHAATWLQRQA